MKPRSRSAARRRIRSRLAQLMTGEDWLRATLTERARRCGKANCHCAKGEPHVSLYLVQSREGKTHQLFVPKEWEARVRAWVKCWQDIHAMLEEESQEQWRRIEERLED